MSEVVLKETANTRVGNVKIGVGNVWEREYALPDGSMKTGMSARVSLEGAIHFLGVGSELDVEGVRYRVSAIDKEPGKLGLVHLEPVT